MLIQELVSQRSSSGTGLSLAAGGCVNTESLAWGLEQSKLQWPGLAPGAEPCSPDWFCSLVLGTVLATQFQVWFPSPHWQICKAANVFLINSFQPKLTRSSSVYNYKPCMLLTQQNPTALGLISHPNLSLYNFLHHFLLFAISFSPHFQILFANI